MRHSDNNLRDELHGLSPEDLRWSAFLYVAGEMDSSECESFESRLAVDQNARDAVAEAVELSCSINSTETVTPASHHSKMWFGLPAKSVARFASRSIAVVAAASLIGLAVFAISSMLHNSDEIQTAGRTDSESTQYEKEVFVLAWIQTHSAWDEASDSVGDFEIVDEWDQQELENEDSEPDDFDSDDFDSDDIAVPNWMLIGLQKLDGATLPQSEQVQ